MTDVVSSEVRSRMMAGIRATNTKPELQIRKALYAKGFRYRLHDRQLPGNPDIVFRSRKAAIFINGCFWHAHDCSLFKWPHTRPERWKNKLLVNRARDLQVKTLIHDIGWRQIAIWECCLRGAGRQDISEVIDMTSLWISGVCLDEEITGRG
jgi:DNA mismatch endonuclease (patch repair protein)